MDWDGNSYKIEELTEKSFGDVDIALFSAGGSISKKFAPIASDAGCTVCIGHLQPSNAEPSLLLLPNKRALALLAKLPVQRLL